MTSHFKVNILIIFIGSRYNSQTNQTYNFQVRSDNNKIDSINFDFNIDQIFVDKTTTTTTRKPFYANNTLVPQQNLSTSPPKSYTIIRLYSSQTNETIINLSLQVVNSSKYLVINGHQLNIRNDSYYNTKYDKIQFKFHANYSELFINSLFYLKIKYQNESLNGLFTLRVGADLCIDNLNINIENQNEGMSEVALVEQYYNQTIQKYFSSFRILNKNCKISAYFDESDLELVSRENEAKSQYYQCDLNPCENNSTCENFMTYNYLGNLNAPPQFYPLNYLTTTQSPYMFISKYILKNDYKCKCSDSLKYNDKNCANKKSICDYEFVCVNNGTCVQMDDAFNCLCEKNYVGERCEIYDPCKENLCSVYSTCQPNRQSDYECICQTGYMGQYCEIKINDTCYLENQCKNNGKCIDKYDTNGNLKYECICQSDFEGKNCENYVDFCGTNRPCRNNATCYNLRSTNINQYACICQKGWKGLNCDEDIDECVDFPDLCKNNGICMNLVGSFECKCPSQFYYGQYCENKHVCLDDFNAPHEIKLCKNDGKCAIKGAIEDNKHECNCVYGYEGESCTLVTCNTNPCSNNATCLDLAMNETISSILYECNCSNTGYTGPLCNDFIIINNQTFICDSNSSIKCDDQLIQFQRIIMKTSQYDVGLMSGRPPGRDYIYHFIIWPLLGLMLILAMTLLVIILMKVKKSRATRGTYSPSRHEQHSSRIEFNMDLKRPPEERLI